MAPMHVQSAREVPEYEIDPKELDFSDSVHITKVARLSVLKYVRLSQIYWYILELPLHILVHSVYSSYD